MNQMKTSSLSEKTMLGIALLMFAVVLNYSQFSVWLDRLVFDAFLNLQPYQQTEEVVLVVIDDKSLEQLGGWPWPRRFHAKLLDKLIDSKAVGMDIIFSEADDTDPAGDQALAEAIKRHGKVVLPISPTSITSVNGIQELSSIPMFVDAAASMGHVDVEIDNDGISRSVFLKAGKGSPDKSTLPLAMLELEDMIKIDGERNRHLINDPKAWVRDHRVLLPLSSNPGNIRKISYIDAADQATDTSIFKDKWVLVGMNATGLGDRIPTAAIQSNRNMAGVEFEAQILDSLLRGTVIKPLHVHQNMFLTLPFIFLFFLLMNTLRTEKGWLAVIIPMTAVFLACFSFSRLGIFNGNFWFRPGPILLTLFLGYLWFQRHQLSSFVMSLTKEKMNANVALNTISDAIVITDKSGQVEFMNAHAESLTGHSFKNAQGEALSKVISIKNKEGEACPIDLAVKNRMAYQDKKILNTHRVNLEEGNILKYKTEFPETFFLKKRDSHLVPIRATTSPLIDGMDKVNGTVIAFKEFKEDESGTGINVVDEITGLPTISILYDRLTQAISNASRTEKLVMVLYIDLMEFSKINDALGTESGDMLLREIARRLKSRGRAGDTVATAGDDEFIVLLENIEDTNLVAAIATSILETIREPVLLDEHQVSIEASIGISSYPKDGADTETLKNNAYTAMKQAKRSRHMNLPRFRFYSHKMNKWALDRLLSEEDLRNALLQNDFELYYQPRVDFNSGKILAVEALIRWRRSREGVIMPASFIPLAEHSGLIREIGTWVLRTACEQAKAWEKAGLLLPRVSINISPRQFMQNDLVGTITNILNETGLQPHFLELEITENSLVSDTERCIEILSEFRAMGGRVSIDDFGTGYSSLSYLKNFPIDTLKIDKIFIQEITSEPDHAAITMAVISMAHSLHLQVVAEGVENEAQFDFLRKNGCDELQGYYFCKPLPAAEITQMLEKNHRLKMSEVQDDDGATTLLLVDDDSELLSQLSIMLRHEGYQILMAENGEDALNLLAKNPVGVVISDEVMPGIRGGDLLEKIKKLHPNTIRLLMSATADRDDIISAINSGEIFKFLNKPITESGLKDALKESFNLYNRRHKVIEEPVV